MNEVKIIEYSEDCDDLIISGFFEGWPESPDENLISFYEKHGYGQKNAMIIRNYDRQRGLTG